MGESHSVCCHQGHQGAQQHWSNKGRWNSGVRNQVRGTHHRDADCTHLAFLFSTVRVPTDFKLAIVVPIHKGKGKLTSSPFFFLPCLKCWRSWSLYYSHQTWRARSQLARAGFIQAATQLLLCWAWAEATSIGRSISGLLCLILREHLT